MSQPLQPLLPLAPRRRARRRPIVRDDIRAEIDALERELGREATFGDLAQRWGCHVTEAVQRVWP